MDQPIESTKVLPRHSHEALEESGKESAAEKLDKVAMEGAKKGQNRIHGDETKTPGSSEFTH